MALLPPETLVLKRQTLIEAVAEQQPSPIPRQTLEQRRDVRRGTFER